MSPNNYLKNIMIKGRHQHLNSIKFPKLSSYNGSIKFISHIFPIFLIIVCLAICIIIYKDTLGLYLSLTKNGIETFVNIFQIPLKFLFYSITSWGIFLALAKFIQSEYYFNSQFMLNQKNILFNNYFHHLDLYVKEMGEFIYYFKKNINQKPIVFENGSNIQYLQIPSDTKLLENRVSENFF